MFVGSVPREVVTQLLRVTDIRPGDKVFVCCSGSFRVDLAIKTTHPGVRVAYNGVSLLICAVGAASRFISARSLRGLRQHEGDCTPCAENPHVYWVFDINTTPL